MIMGDGPSMSGGPSVELDWTPQNESFMSLDEYEKRKSRRRPPQSLMIPGAFRAAMLLESGYTLNEIHQTASKSPSPPPPQKPTLGKGLASKLRKVLKSKSSKSL